MNAYVTTMICAKELLNCFRTGLGLPVNLKVPNCESFVVRGTNAN